jgi:hypothetical protein
VDQWTDYITERLAQVDISGFIANFRLEIETLHDSWLAVLKDELTKDYFLKVRVFTRNAHSS